MTASRVATALVVALVCVAAVTAVRAEEETTDADEFELVHGESFVASERTDVIAGGVAAEKAHVEAAGPESMRFAAVDASAAAAHAAEMEVQTDKKRSRWPVSPDHPGKRLGCWITQTHCIRHPNKFVGTFRDVWGEKNVGAGRDEAKCLARAQEYHVYCGNPHVVSTTAKFRNTNRHTSYPPTGCWIHQSQCNRDATWTGVFRDAWGEKNLATGTDEARCLKRAREYAVWCGNTHKHTTMAEFRGSGNTRYYPARKGCFISQDLCVKHPATASPWPFRDLYGEKNVKAGQNEQNCMARAREYHQWCGNPMSAVTKAEFRPTLKRASYPAVDKVQVEAAYAFGKVAWADAERSCKAKGKNLCMRSELCPNGFPIRGRPQGDHWIAVRDMENGWASIGTAFPERVCKLHQEIDGGHYGKPTWGYDQYNHPQLCCDDPDEVVWAKTLALPQSITWNDARKACKDDGLKLCPRSAYCPDGAGKAPAGGITEGDHWAPTSDYPNSWVSVGDYDAVKRVCQLHDEVTGAAPVWGTQPSTYKFKGHVRCCARDDACRTAPCANGGKCIAGEGDAYTCQCREGFVGKNCAQENKCSADKNPCQNGAECQSVGASGDYQCTCKAGFSGKNCEVNDPCSLTPCRNGAECKNTPDAKRPFQCTCKPGFSGRLCGVKNPCTSNPCKNGSRCIRKSDSKFKCKCKAGFKGKRCGVNIDDCTPQAIASCKNGGKCVDGINTYTCNCDGTKFAGPSCTQYGLKGFSQVPGGRGELFIDDDQREDDLGANVVKVQSYALPGSTVEINGKLKTAEGAEAVPGIIASFKFRGAKYSTGADWECSTDEGKTYRRAKVLEGRELPADVAADAKYIWAKNLNASPVTCRMRLPMKNLASGTRVVLPVKNRIAPLCSRSNGASVTYYYGEVCANGGVQWNHMHTKGRRSGLTQSQCAWSRKAMKDNAAWLANWLGSCTEAPKMLFPKLPSARASFYTKARVEEDPCKASPCGANAACKWTRMGPLPYKCTCAKGFTGDGKKCIEIDNCAQNPCSKNAWCRRTGPGKHTCTCKKGYAGSGEKKNCKAINNCLNKVSPCSPRATCTMTGAGTHTCACKAGYKGDGVKCKAINNCRAAKKPCSKHAVCAPTGPGQHRCTCRQGFKGDGKKCKAINACKAKKNPCDKNATCFKTGPNKYRCECNKGWKGTGKQCREVNMCKQSKPCHENATCTHKGAGKYSCQCNKNFEGDGKSCVALDMCARAKPCDPQAVCTMTGAGKFSCKCKEGFRGSGKKCKEIDICKKANPCHRNARCKKTGPGVATCKCRKGYSGDGRKCKPIDKCKENPCDGNAKCKVTGPGKFSCKCRKGWEGNGKSCKEKNACHDKPCDGHAKCTSTGPGTFKCACREGFKGDGFACTEINDCDTPGLCNENANCMKTGPGQHKCICKAGFRGDGVHCTEVDACADHPCHAKATCSKTSPGNFKCECINGFEGDGRSCKAVNACAKKPCGEHATCTSTGPNTYSCSCQRGFRGNGQICNEIDSCKERPCPGKSTCMRTGPGRHRCKCAFGHRWSRAAKGCVGIDVCKARKGVKNPCAKEAACESTGPGTAKCACKQGFEGDGKTCTAIDSCKSNPCGRGEQCKSTGPGTHKCSCAAGHKRKDAKECVAINKCADAKDAKKALCGAHGTCSYTAPGKYKCVCNAGYKRVAAPGKTKSGKARSKCVEVKGCDANPCSAYAVCTNKPMGKFECKCKPKFSGDGIKCIVQPGLKAITVAGKLQLVPIAKGDKHDDQLSVIEAMLGSLAADGDQPKSAIAAVEPKVAEPNLKDRSKLQAVARRVNTLEATTKAMAEQAAAETQALLNLQKSSKAETERLFQVLAAKTDGAFDAAIDATHATLTHTPHRAGEHVKPQDVAPEAAVTKF